MFAKLSDTIARSFVARGTISEERFSICRYGIKQLFSVCLNLLTTLCIGMVFGLVWESVLFTAAYIPLRSFAGGFHAKTPVLLVFGGNDRDRAGTAAVCSASLVDGGSGIYDFQHTVVAACTGRNFA